jgi:phosphoserine phosphatase RsbU/P
MLDETGELVGVINLESPQIAAFSEDDKRLLQALAAQGVFAWRSVTRFEAEQRARRELELLADIDRAISSTLELETVLQLIVQRSSELIHGNLFQVFLFDKRQKDLYIAAESGLYESPRYYRQPIDKGIVGYVASENKSVLINNVHAPEWEKHYVDFTPGTQSELAVPMIQEDRLIGVLNVESARIDAFREDDKRLLEALARVAVIAVYNAELYRQERESKEVLDALRRVDAAINSGTRLEEVIRYNGQRQIAVIS